MNTRKFAIKDANMNGPLLLLIISVIVSLGAPNQLNAQTLPPPGLRLERGEYWTNFTQIFPFHADGRFSIDNVNGRIEIHGWNSNAVLIAVAIHGQTPNSVE